LDGAHTPAVPHSHCQWLSSQLHLTLTPRGPSTVSRGNPRQITAVTYSITDTCKKMTPFAVTSLHFSLPRIQGWPRPST
jgi:hypothetical protein